MVEWSCCATFNAGALECASGQHVEIGEEIGLCGNSGNSTEPHVHVQAIDSVDIEHAAAVPITFNGTMPSNGGIVTV